MEMWIHSVRIEGLGIWLSGALRIHGNYFSHKRETLSFSYKNVSLLNQFLLSTSQPYISGSPKPPAVCLWILTAQRP